MRVQKVSGSRSCSSPSRSMSCGASTNSTCNRKSSTPARNCSKASRITAVRRNAAGLDQNNADNGEACSLSRSNSSRSEGLTISQSSPQILKSLQANCQYRLDDSAIELRHNSGSNEGVDRRDESPAHSPSLCISEPRSGKCEFYNGMMPPFAAHPSTYTPQACNFTYSKAREHHVIDPLLGNAMNSTSPRFLQHCSLRRSYDIHPSSFLDDPILQAPMTFSEQTFFQPNRSYAVRFDPQSSSYFANGIANTMNEMNSDFSKFYEQNYCVYANQNAHRNDQMATTGFNESQSSRLKFHHQQQQLRRKVASNSDRKAASSSKTDGYSAFHNNYHYFETPRNANTFVANANNRNDSMAAAANIQNRKIFYQQQQQQQPPPHFKPIEMKSSHNFHRNNSRKFYATFNDTLPNYAHQSTISPFYTLNSGGGGSSSSSSSSNYTNDAYYPANRSPEQCLRANSSDSSLSSATYNSSHLAPHNQLQINPHLQGAHDLPQQQLQRDDIEQSKKKQQQQQQHIKRPMNAFMVWARNERQVIAAENCELKNSDISKILGKKWREMSDEERRPFKQQAGEIFEEHLRKHPDYKYKPRRRVRKQTKLMLSESEKDIGGTSHKGSKSGPGALDKISLKWASKESEKTKRARPFSASDCASLKNSVNSPSTQCEDAEPGVYNFLNGWWIKKRETFTDIDILELEKGEPTDGRSEWRKCRTPFEYENSSYSNISGCGDDFVFRKSNRFNSLDRDFKMISRRNYPEIRSRYFNEPSPDTLSFFRHSGHSSFQRRLSQKESRPEEEEVSAEECQEQSQHFKSYSPNLDDKNVTIEDIDRACFNLYKYSGMNSNMEQKSSQRIKGIGKVFVH